MKAKLIVVTISIVLSLVAIEVIIRIFSPQPNIFLREYNIDGILWNRPNYDDLLANVLRSSYFPSDRGDFFVKSYPFPVNLNSEGQRNDRDFNFKKDASKVRILNLGDSIGFGMPLKVEDSYAKQLENLVPHSEVINASTPLCSTSRFLEYYQKRGYRWNPDILILQMTISGRPFADYIFLDQFGKDPFEIFFLEHLGYGNFVSSHLSKDEVGVKQLQIQNEEEKRFVYETLNTYLKRKKYSFYDLLHLFRLMNSLRYNLLSEIFIDLNNPFLNYDDNLEKSFSPKFTQYYLDILHKEVMKNGSKLLVVIVPNLFGCWGKSFHAWDSVVSYLEAHKIHYIDLRKSFCDMELHEPREGIFKKHEYHPGEVGHKILAEEIATYINKKLLPSEEQR